MNDARLIFQLTVITAWCDGRLKDAEARELEAQGLSQEETIGLALEAKEKLDRLGLAGALSEVAAGLLGRDPRERAFVACARILEADGTIAREEFQVLARLRTLFALGPEDVSRLLQSARS
jgi:hypothetical protein